MMTRFKELKKFILPAMMWLIFEIIAITLLALQRKIYFIYLILAILEHH